MSLLEQYRQVSVSDLADRFEVSSLTIRRDLDELEAQGLITRSYGMATLLDPLSTGLSSNQVTAKFKLAQAAAKLIKNGDTVFINTSSTAIKVLEFITAENITIVTNNGSVLAADYPPSMTVLVTGGEVRPAKKSMTGDFALASINQIRAAKCILGCSGISAERGLTTLVSNEMRVNSLMLKHSEQHIVLADSSKLGINSSFQYGSPSDIDVLMTADSSRLKVKSGELRATSGGKQRNFALEVGFKSWLQLMLAVISLVLKIKHQYFNYHDMKILI